MTTPQAPNQRRNCWLLSVALPLAMALTDVTLAQPVPGENHVRLVRDLQGFSGVVTDLAFSPDGLLLAACGEKVVRIWDMRTGQLLHTLRGQIGDGSYGDCLAVTFSPDNCELVVGIRSHSQHGSLRVYDTRNFTEIKELVRGHNLPVTRLAFSADGRYLATADIQGAIQIFDWPLRRIVARAQPVDAEDPTYQAFQFPGDELFLLAYTAQAASVITVPAGRHLGPDPRVPTRLARWIREQTEAAFPLDGERHALDVRLDRDTWLACGRGTGNQRGKHWIGIWRGDRSGPRFVYERHEHEVTAATLDSSCALAASADKLGEIRVWETATGRQRLVLRSLGRPVYRAALDLASRRIGFTNRATQGDSWTYNSFGIIDRMFDFNRRHILPAGDGAFPDEVTGRGNARLSLTYRNERFAVRLSGVPGRSLETLLSAGTTPGCYTFLSAGGFGLEYPIVLGDYSGGLYCFEAAGRRRRNFHGHTNLITSISESEDGRFLTTASRDRTIRIWSLASWQPAVWVGFQHDARTVTEVPPGSPAETAGIRVGDRFLALDGRGLVELSVMQAEGTYDYQAGQRVLVTMERNGVQYQTEVVLSEGPDIVEPILTLLVAGESGWIMWTPQGYYDASPGAGNLVGFHVNRGVDRSASFLPVHQFRRQLYRPDIINQIFETSNVQQAITAANQGLPQPAAPVDLRKPQTIKDQSPPHIRILSPEDGTVTEEGQIHVLAEIVSQNDLPITDVRVLVNGRPGLAKGASVIAEGADGTNRIDFSRALQLLPGENSISLLASNESATSVPFTVNVTYNAPPEVSSRKPNLHLLSIGVSNYENQRLNLQYAHVDAQEFSQAWESQRGPLYKDVVSELLVNEDASAARVRTALEDLLAGVGRRDITVIFISAHGVRDSLLEYYLGTYDVDISNLPETGLHFSVIGQFLEQLPCKVLMFVDTCHSAGITGAKSIFQDPLYELTSDEYGTIVFSSSLSREISFENEAWGHGAFTKAILDTLSDRKSDINGDGYLSLTELEQRVYDEVQAMTEGRQHPVMNRPSTVPNLRFYFVGGTPAD